MEHDLVRAAQRGDQAAFMDLIRPRSDRLFAIAIQILRDINRSEENAREPPVRGSRASSASRSVRRDREGARSFNANGAPSA